MKKNETMLFAGKWIELENNMLNKVSQVQWSQSSHDFPHVWKPVNVYIDTYMIIYIYTYIHVFTHIHIYSEKENKTVLLSPFEGALGGGRGKKCQNEKYWNNPSLCEHNIMNALYCELLTMRGAWWQRMSEKWWVNLIKAWCIQTWSSMVKPSETINIPLFLKMKAIRVK
jgi:hypothetical protein